MQDWYEEKVCEVLSRWVGELNDSPKIITMPHGYYEGEVVEIAPSLTSHSSHYNNIVLEPIKDMNEPQVLTPKRTEEGKRMRKDYEAHKVNAQRKEMQKLEPREDGVSNTLTTAQKDNYLMVPSNTAEGYVQCEIGGVLDISYPTSTSRRGRVQEGGAVAPTLTCGCETTHARIEDNAIKDIEMEKKQKYRIRKLTEREAFRLMGVKDEDSDRIREVVSRSQCYKLAGNSIVVDVMVHMFDQLFFNNKNTNQQLELF